MKTSKQMAWNYLSEESARLLSERQNEGDGPVGLDADMRIFKDMDGKKKSEILSYRDYWSFLRAAVMH